jgi:hypothetical protein
MGCAHMRCCCCWQKGSPPDLFSAGSRPAAAWQVKGGRGALEQEAAVQHSSAQLSTAQHSTTRRTAQHSTAQHHREADAGLRAVQRPRWLWRTALQESFRAGPASQQQDRRSAAVVWSVGHACVRRLRCSVWRSTWRGAVRPVAGSSGGSQFLAPGAPAVTSVLRGVLWPGSRAQRSTRHACGLAAGRSAARGTRVISGVARPAQCACLRRVVLVLALCGVLRQAALQPLGYRRVPSGSAGQSRVCSQAAGCIWMPGACPPKEQCWPGHRSGPLPPQHNAVQEVTRQLSRGGQSPAPQR